MLRASHTLSATLLAVLAAVAAPAHALVTVTAEATNQSDTTVGQDLWRLDFHVTGAMALNDFVNFALSSQLFSNVAQLGALPSGFSSSLTQPIFFGDSYNYRVTDAGSSATSFDLALSVVRIGALPNTIGYTQTGGNGFGNATLTITPAAPVPEPATYGLMALGLLAMGLRRRAQKD